jgi:hypothetical protein
MSDTIQRLDPTDLAAVKAVVDQAAVFEFLKLDTGAMTRLALVPGVEMLWAPSHYNKDLGSILCLAKQDPPSEVCCNAFGAARQNLIAKAFVYLTASRVDGTLSDQEIVIPIAPRIMRLAPSTLDTMVKAAKEKGVTIYEVDWRATKSADGKKVIIQVISLSPRWKKVEEEAMRLAAKVTTSQLAAAVGKKVSVAEIIATGANAGSGVVDAPPVVEVLD